MRPRLDLLALPSRHHFWGSLAIVLLVAVVISAQIADRHGFANSELYQEVAERWGAPIDQPAPSVRFVESGAVFNHLDALPLARQHVAVDAAMSYRRRGLVYFSGFEFTFRGDYRIENDRGRSLDLVFVFPIQLDKNRVLLSDLAFTVDGRPAKIDLAENGDQLAWTGRLAAGEALDVAIAFAGRGLHSFTYRLDPALPVRDFELAVAVEGGEGYDFAAGVAPAAEVDEHGDRLAMTWRYAALESGVPVGLILPAEKSWDRILATMVRRAPVPFVLFFASLVALAVARDRPLRWYETYLAAAAYAFFFVLLAYLAAYMSFALAYALALAAVGALLLSYLRRVLGRPAVPGGAAALAAFLFVPTLAVVLEGHTGLIYTLEILAGLVWATVVVTRPGFRRLLDRLPASGGNHPTEEAPHAL